MNTVSNRASLEDRLWVATFIAAVGSDVLSGVVRYYTSMIGVPQAAYLPKALMFAWVLYTLLRRPKATHAFIAFYMLAESCVSLSHGVAPEAVGFWLWTVMPMLFALTASPQALMMLNGRAATTAFAVLAALCGIGILANTFMPMPWVGVSVSVGGHNVRAAVASYVGMASRLSGFGRDSASTGLMAGLLTTWLLMRTPKRWMQCALLVAAGAAIHATTNKTAPVSLALVVAVHCLFSTMTFKRASLCAAAFAVVFPLASFVAELMFNLSGTGFTTLASFQDRMFNTWPILLEGLLKDNRIWLGLGPGGFGSATTYYESAFGFNVAYADNTVLYALANFGFFGAVLLVGFFVRLMVRAEANDRPSWAMLLFLLFASATTDICESIGCLLFLGITISYLRENATLTQPHIWRMPTRFMPAGWRARNMGTPGTTAMTVIDTQHDGLRGL
ncbi:O-antigen ligase family protein [Caballeronia concitans]|uniref:O-antigen polymerase n=1 Tax=Caballeronia concitans TaxID=1777133 RepID=A0A658QY61_9BURK|nr:hypothetical protein [Caballeronia concitans]KIG11370.1 hypothetical protein BurMR1_1651 [Burkholderia sp. MR1]SAL32646.1 hypothetical protein AWB72_02955 [Caballeronia concitans]